MKKFKNDSLKKKILIICMFIIVFLLMQSKCYAVGSFSISSSPSSNVEPGTSVTIKITANNVTGQISLTGTNITLSESVIWVEDDTVTVTGTIGNEGTTATVTATPLVLGDSTTAEKITKPQTITITIKQQETQPPAETTPEQPTEPEPEQPTEPETPTNPEPEQPKEPEPTITNMQAVMYTTDNLNIRESYNSNSKIIGSLNKGDSVNIIGKVSNGWYKIRMSSGREGYVSGYYLTDTKPNQSSTTTLSNLTVSPGNLNETFSKDTLTYTMTVNSDVDSITVNFTPTDSNAKVTVTGNTGLTAGTGNEIKIKVVAEDGISTRTYAIKVTKLATEDDTPNIIDEEPQEIKLGLSSLSIEGLKLTPNFKTDIYEYEATLTDKSIEKLIVNAIALFEDSKVEIIGADEIQDGENVITIIVTSANEEETVTYQIIVNKTEQTAIAIVEPNKNEDSKSNIIIAVVAVIAIIALIGACIFIKKREKATPVRIYEDGDYNEPENEYNSYEEDYSPKDETSQEYNDDDDDDDDWGTPKRGLLNKFKKTGRHF